MQANHETLLCRYHYDPLDRLSVCTPAEQASSGRFYQKSRLATEIQGLVQHSIFQYDDQLLAQHQRQGGTVATTLLITDQQRSVLSAPDATPPRSSAYTPYGHRPVGNGLLSLLSLLGFNGERPDPVTGHYHLGNGYRQFNPVLMRFNSPDSWSPFGKGGINAYAYCAGDPINRADPTGHVLKQLMKMVEKKGGFNEIDSFHFKLQRLQGVMGGNKEIKKLAAAAGTKPKKYLFNKLILAEMDEAVGHVDWYKDQISMSTSYFDVIGLVAGHARMSTKYDIIRGKLNKFSSLLPAETNARRGRWVLESVQWDEEAMQIADNKLKELASSQYPPPPAYSIDDPWPAPSPGGTANNIRQQ